MSFPEVTNEQIETMNKLAAIKMQEDGFDPQAYTQEQEPQEQIYDQNDQIIEQESYEQPEQQAVEEYVEEPVKTQPKSRENNFKVMRERAERAEYERQQALDYIASLKKHEPEDVDVDDFTMQDDDLAEGRHLKTLRKEIKELKSLLKESQNQSKAIKKETIQMRLESQFPDINRVLTDENRYELEANDPDLFEVISNTQDEYKKNKLMYQMIKSLNIYQEKPSYRAEKTLVQKNIAKPRSMSSVRPTQNDSPLSKVNAFQANPDSPEAKRYYYEEALKYSNGRF